MYHDVYANRCNRTENQMQFTSTQILCTSPQSLLDAPVPLPNVRLLILSSKRSVTVKSQHLDVAVATGGAGGGGVGVGSTSTTFTTAFPSNTFRTLSASQLLAEFEPREAVVEGEEEPENASQNALPSLLNIV